MPETSLIADNLKRRLLIRENIFYELGFVERAKKRVRLLTFSEVYVSSGPEANKLLLGFGG